MRCAHLVSRHVLAASLTDPRHRYTHWQPAAASLRDRTVDSAVVILSEVDAEVKALETRLCELGDSSMPAPEPEKGKGFTVNDGKHEEGQWNEDVPMYDIGSKDELRRSASNKSYREAEAIRAKDGELSSCVCRISMHVIMLPCATFLLFVLLTL